MGRKPMLGLGNDCRVRLEESTSPPTLPPVSRSEELIGSGMGRGGRVLSIWGPDGREKRGH